MACRDEEVVVVALHEHELYVGRCSDFGAMVALGKVVAENAAVCPSVCLQSMVQCTLQARVMTKTLRCAPL